MNLDFKRDDTIRRYFLEFFYCQNENLENEKFIKIGNV